MRTRDRAESLVVNNPQKTKRRDLAWLAAEAQTIAVANAALSDYHRGRRQALATE